MSFFNTYVPVIFLTQRVKWSIGTLKYTMIKSSVELIIKSIVNHNYILEQIPILNKPTNNRGKGHLSKNKHEIFLCQKGRGQILDPVIFGFLSPTFLA